MPLRVHDRTVTILGDSLSASATAPGGVLATYLRRAGATDVHVNGKVSRSAINFFVGHGEDGAAILATEAAARPDVVIVFLGTNDMGMGAAADVAAFTRIRSAFVANGAEVWSIGPPAFASTTRNTQAVTVYATLRSVFGADRVLDLRPLTTDVPRKTDGIHFTTAGGATTGQRIAAALLAPGDAVAMDTIPTAMTVPAAAPWSIAAAASAVVLVGIAVLIRRRQRLALSGARPYENLDDFEAQIDEAKRRPAFFKQSVMKIQDAANQLQAEGAAFGGVRGHKVFIDDIARRLGSKTSRIAGLLLVGQQQGWIQLARADLVGAMDPVKVDASEITAPTGGDVHFVVVDPQATLEGHLAFRG